MQRARELAEQLADAVLARTLPRLALPVPVDEIVGSLGLAGPIEEEISQDGRLEYRDRPTVVKKYGQPPARQRFTVAHEIGHWLLDAAPFEEELLSEIRCAFRSDEVFCDTFAGALLMPRSWLVPRYGSALRTANKRLPLIEGVAREAHVSMAAATIRIRDVFGLNQTLLSWTLMQGGWQFKGEAGLFPWEQGRVTPTENVLLAVSQAAYAATPPTTGYLPLRVDGYDGDIPCELSVRGQSVFALLQLQRRKDSSPRRPRRPRDLLAIRADRAARG